MAKFTDYYKFITPQTATTIVQDSQSIDGASASFGQYSWQNRLVQGSYSRVTRYREYENMDADAEVARALDIIAEEMCSTSAIDQLPLEVVINGEDGQQTMSEIELLTVKTALREWCNLHQWNSRLFKVCRNTIKYGDCIFRKKSVFERWEWIPPGNVMGAVVDADNVTKVRGFQVRNDTKEPRPIGGVLAAVGSGADADNTSIIPSTNIVRFAIDDDMSDSAPFGDSVLRPVVKAFKQKDMLEDSILIYRIQRAPERRVFKIEVGKMPPQRIKQFLETIKNEFRQKKVPTTLNGQDQMESVYNPLSTQEDFWFAKTPTGGSDVTILPGGCLAMDTEVVLLDGSVKTVAELADDYEQGIENWTFSTDPQSGEIVPGVVSWAGVTQSSAQVVRLTFSNGEQLICTPDHKFPILGQGLVRADQLAIGGEMIPFQYAFEDGEHCVYQRPFKEWVSVASLVDSVEVIPPTSFQQLSQYDSFANRNIPFVKHVKLTARETLAAEIEVGTLTIDVDEDLHDHHNFSLAIGIFTQNSNLGEITDLDYWANKVIRGLRVPVSWMQFGRGNDAQSSDGRPGQSYVEEIRFALFVERLQQHINRTMDEEFKLYLSACNILVDKSRFYIKLLEPMNFRQYRQVEIDQMLLSNLQTADQIQYLSKRYILSRFLQLDENDITTNELLAHQERGLVKTPKADIVELYGAEAAGVTMGSDFGGGGGGGFSGGGGDFDMGDTSDTGAMEPDMGEFGDEEPMDLGGEESEPAPGPEEK